MIEEFLGIDLSEDQVSGIIAAVKSNLLGEDAANKESAPSDDVMDFNNIIKSLSKRLDLNDDGKIGVDDFVDFTNDFSKQDSKKDNLDENPIKSFKI